MQISFPVRSFFKPSCISMVAVSASVSAWLFPTFGILRKGFDHPSRLDANSVIILACWYLLIFASFFFGQKLAGLSVPVEGYRSESRTLGLESNAVYLCFTFLAALGLGSMLSVIFQNMSFRQAVLFISLGQTNALKESLYEDYHVGLVSLRYVVLYSASIALYRIVGFKRYSLLNIFNVLMLALSAFLSYRLILIAALMVTSFLLSFSQKVIKVSVGKLLVIATSLFLILSVLNLSRNADFYERNKLSFGLAGLNEIVAYLGTPFQVAIGATSVTDQLAAQGPGDPIHGTEPYRYYVDIGINYNTNSAFVALHQKMGYWCWPYVTGLCLFMGIVFRTLIALGKTYFLLPCGAILYASSELWRLDLFEQGTFIIWFVVGIGVPLFVSWLDYFFATLKISPMIANRQGRSDS
ncbi:hypothetical protein [Granulicella sibirica]|uniref:Oligosaccharide repeat unit polymerase n=1 Tax=Granulicella sibirica TaxID=2479048 RepID=A0A4Q0T614_9BACT|nr:hypothetical protein [Granulicella sibirica]RXH58442.1 hypothetical protein GRAN_1752 [Granulicella sibirica]